MGVGEAGAFKRAPAGYKGAKFPLQQAQHGAAPRRVRQGSAEKVQGHAPPTHLWQVQVDFVSIKIGVEGGAVGVVEADGALRCKCNNMAMIRLGYGE